LGTIVELERVVKKHIAKDKQEELVRQKKKDKYDRIYNACLLQKGSTANMQVSEIIKALKDTCMAIARKLSWLEKLRYD
jgi:hypothetical protein